MFRKSSFILIFAALFCSLAWWSDHVKGSVRNFAEESELASKRDLIEALDRVVAYEHYYRSVYGHFTKIITRTGYSIPQSILDSYDIRASEATKDKLVLSAFSEVDGRTVDIVSVDQDFQVQTNFPLPVPRAEYLRALAFKHLRVLRDAPNGQIPDEAGIYRGYFKYELFPGSAQAIGQKTPVLGMRVEFSGSEKSLGEEEFALTNLDRDSSDRQPKMGTGQMIDNLEEAYLAQKIFRGEFGRYARTWAELSKITHFRFESQGELNSKVPFSDGVPASIAEIHAANIQSQLDQLKIQPVAPDVHASQSDRKPAGGDQNSEKLEIEALSSDGEI